MRQASLAIASATAQASEAGPRARIPFGSTSVFPVREVAEPLQEDFPWGWWLGCQGRAAGGGIELVL